MHRPREYYIPSSSDSSKKVGIGAHTPDLRTRPEVPLPLLLPFAAVIVIDDIQMDRTDSEVYERGGYRSRIHIPGRIGHLGGKESPVAIHPARTRSVGRPVLSRGAWRCADFSDIADGLGPCGESGCTSEEDCIHGGMVQIMYNTDTSTNPPT